MPDKEQKPKLARVEKPPEAEKTAESPREISKPDLRGEKKAAPLDLPKYAPLTAVPPAPVPTKDPLLQQVEAILSEDLKDLYGGLPDDVKPKFRAKGEEVALVIKAMVERAKIKTRRVLKLIRQWLSMIPGVNKFFLEQSAAIKTQKITLLVEQQKKK
ncbi:hypothetical protein HY477_03270 [Candidatus Uhrbacteria bacterium]|nr:hypothetical protein [Candidatus Uhrbacteria bacterium]